MKNKKKKISVMILIVLLIAVIVIATVSINKLIENRVNSGTVEVENINLTLTEPSGNSSKEIADWEPGDVDEISWTVKNVGTSAVYTRNKLIIYWNDEIPDESSIITLYPANLTRKQVTEDFKKGENSEYALDLQLKDITLEDGTVKKGIEYSFLGDVLDGTIAKNVSTEVNYNSSDFNSKTDDNVASEDSIAFNILFSLYTTPVYAGKFLSIKVVTEAMQYSAEGKAEWQIVDSQTIGD